MTSATLTPPIRPAPPAVPDVPVRRLTVEQYHDLLRLTPFSDREPVELLEGWLVEKMGEDAIHAVVVDVTARMLLRVVPPGWDVRGPHPVTTPDSEPEPDVAVVRGRLQDYYGRHPTPADSAMIVEVANSSLSYDRGIKQRIYARAGVPVYWIVVLRDRSVEVYADPSGPTADPGYAPPRVYRVGDRVPVVIDGREVGTVVVADLLP